MERNKAWSCVRWAEFVTLGIALAIAVIDTISEHDIGISPETLATLALISKALRAMLAYYGRLKASTVHPVSWIVAILMAIVSYVLPTVRELNINSLANKPAVEVLHDTQQVEAESEADVAESGQGDDGEGPTEGGAL